MVCGSTICDTALHRSRSGMESRLPSSENCSAMPCQRQKPATPIWPMMPDRRKPAAYAARLPPSWGCHHDWHVACTHCHQRTCFGWSDPGPCPQGNRPGQAHSLVVALAGIWSKDLCVGKAHLGGTSLLARGTPTFCDMLVVGGRGNRQDIAVRLDPLGAAIVIDKHDHRLNGRSSSGCAKYADALRRISLACRSSRFSRSSALSRSAGSVGTPARLPLSTSTFFTHSSSVCAEQPIFSAIDVMAA